MSLKSVFTHLFRLSSRCLYSSTIAIASSATPQYLSDSKNHWNQLKIKHRLDTWIRAHDLRQRLCCTPHIDRIRVRYVGKLCGHVSKDDGPTDSLSFEVTKGLSAPIHCAQHLSKSLLVDQSAIALVDGQPWDMHRPLVCDCDLDFVHFKDAHNDPTPANFAFWRSASFMLASTLESAFHPEHAVRLVSNPVVGPETGSFVCDVSFTPTSITKDDFWVPTSRELRALSDHGQRLAAQNLSFEPVDASVDVVNDCFADEPLRRAQINREFGSDGSAVLCIYRAGSYVEACAGGPLITSSRLIGRFSVTTGRCLGWLRNHTPHDDAVSKPILVYRFQGVALPTAFITHFTTFDRLMHWSREPNPKISAKPDYVVDLD